MKIDFDSKTPIYHQIAGLIRKAILAGDLKTGESIPSVRQMCVEYGINPQTILNATQLLIREGVIEKRRGLGMFVTENATDILKESGSRDFREKTLPAVVEKGRILGYTPEDICRMIQSIEKED